VSVIAAATRMGAVHLSVADVERSMDYYATALGLAPHGHDARGGLRLGTGGEDLLVLYERPGAQPADGYAGLFHFALLVPRRADLANWLVHAGQTQVPLTGLSDHVVSEAVYLRDPDGHGIEIYWDRPRAGWEGQVARTLTTLPLDVQSLVAEATGPAGLPRETVMGHVHLRVADVPAARSYYADVLGFEVMAAMGAQAVFLSAGGYHHHVGANAWESAGAPPAPPHLARLERVTIILPDEAALADVVARAGGRDVADPSGNPLRFVAAKG
jgi:catechol 2,3-dioxygenase